MGSHMIEKEWPFNDTFLIEVEEHCEDGHWYGHAHTDGIYDFDRGSNAIQGVLKSKYDELSKKIADAEADVRRLNRINKRLESENFKLSMKLQDYGDE